MQTPNRKKEFLLISTGKKPDVLSVKHFKDRIYGYMKKGYLLEGVIIKGSDGSYSQKIWRYKE